MAQVVPGAAGRGPEQVLVGLGSHPGEEPWRSGGLHQPLEQLGVPVAAQHHQQVPAGLGALGPEQVEEAFAVGLVLGGDLGEAAFEALEEDVGVPHGSERGAEPLEVEAKRVSPMLLEDGAERSQVRAQAPRRDAGLMELLGVNAAPGAGVVGHEFGDRSPERVAHDVAQTPGRSGDGLDVGRLGGSGTQGPHDRGGRVGGAGAGGAQSSDDRGGLRLGGAVGDVDLELSERPDGGVAAHDDHVVVHDVTDGVPLSRSQVHGPADRAQARHRRHRGGARERADQIEGLGGRVGLAAGERVRRPVEGRVTAAPVGELHRPALVAAVAQRYARPGQPEVIGVVVGGDQMAGTGRFGDDAG